MVCFLRFSSENNFLSLFGLSGLKDIFHWLVHSLILMRSLFIISAESKQLLMIKKSDYIIYKNSKLPGRSFMYTKKSKGPSIELCGTPARIGDQLEDWTLRTTLWNLKLKKLWKGLCKLPEIPTVSSLYSNPLCQILSKASETSS